MPNKTDRPTGIRSTPKALPNLRPRNLRDNKIGPRINPHQANWSNTRVPVSMFSSVVSDTEADPSTWYKLKSTKTDAKAKSTQEKKPTCTVPPPPAYTRRNNSTNIPMLNPNNKTRAQ